MRWSLKPVKVLVSCILVGTLLVSMSFYTRCGPQDDSFNGKDSSFYRESHLQSPESMQDQGVNVAWQHLNGLAGDSESISYSEIDCVINDEYKVGCRREGQEVYLPFSFITKYFEVYGKINKVNGVEEFAWKHSYSRVYEPEGKYSAQGIFMSFEHYNVEVRDRVKCISGIEGVPISTQWGPEGYFYPIQIAQYGLSHYSKYLAEPSRVKNVIEDAESGDTARWVINSHDAAVNNIYNPQKLTRVIEFVSSDSLLDNGITFPVGEQSNLFLSFDFRFVTNGSFTVIVEPKGKDVEPMYIHYVCTKTLIHVDKNNIYYGIGSRKQWTRIYRDISIDYQKGLLLRNKKKKKSNLARLRTIIFRGHGWVDNITLSDNAHLAQFYYAANWLVANQDDQGGWPIMVKRYIANGMLELAPGWYSAMAQGQAMSLLVRAYIRTKNKKYLSAALRGTHLYDVPSSEGGVLAKFADKYNWYEEYPTTPSCFVLNGFIYSLLGLYDLRVVAPAKESFVADRLYTTGLESLRALLPLFDTGSGSIYDLRHYTLGVAPNLARWDYHTTHINQLLLLSTIEDDPIYETTAKRWISYMKGHRAPHN